ncbi:hypothetical protein G6F16_003887 [Rhizopus arrhizus]|nr:hypothetical protein G6F21_003900 [Rhizopus arrhizus]KAG0816720.1 hypothetical protein G6F20_002971 [Rhizopus arrhizus]KAG0837469.1 hypothetical protein G6F19_003682 [Rhizopus arrhizus]KAG0846249.1 hypothetical protein G6F18_000198 [Rhizopus arrhizus]KAG0856694.1 hypothetical protein G6F17_004357 [Rhizopus arrhizus]
MIDEELPSEDLGQCLKDGRILCTLINKEYNNDDNSHESVNCLGLDSSFCINDLIYEENMDAVVSTLSALSNVLKQNRFAGESKQEQRMNETCTKRGLKQEDQEYQELGKEHNCIPGFDSHPLDDRDMYYDQDEEEFLDEMYASNTSSRDSGYGTTRTKQNVKDVFNHRLSSLFHSKDSHFVKFKTWSTQQQHKKSVSDSSCTPVKYVTRRKSSSSVIYPVSNVNHLELVDEDRNLLAKYKLGNVIGKGHFGTVYRALDLLSGRTVAIKQIDLKASREQDIEDMMEEASLLSSLTHPNIVKYEGFIQTEKHMHIVLEYVENGSLLNTLKSFGQSLPEHLVASYCQRILKGLVYLHKQHVVHCDLKAANILTTKAGDVKLSDFGVSLNLKLKKDENIVSGTPFWMSPEVIELKGASIKSDIWSLGCTIIELCTGKPPYSDCIAMTAMFKIVEEQCPPIPKHLSTELKNFLKLCFKKNPQDRPSAQELLRHPWVLQHKRPLDISSTTSSPSILMNKAVASEGKKQPRRTSDNNNCITTRQSMPVVSNSYVKQSRHKHSLIDCSFPKGGGTCKVCDVPIKRNALVCRDFCGYIRHKQCTKEAFPNPPEPKPSASVSTQLREKFSISRLISRAPNEPSTTKNPWWKKKSPKQVHS